MTSYLRNQTITNNKDRTYILTKTSFKKYFVSLSYYNFNEYIKSFDSLLFNEQYNKFEYKQLRSEHNTNISKAHICLRNTYLLDLIIFYFQIGSFVLLTAVHIIVLPLLMINMEAGPLHR